ncbi:hypothetical protein EC973_007557 [Apophysomyces ossiformis]|uniref:Uncharacterized protein n=1 Tax=Apophysomyces ossiformis TaxID=679940 RepID=A0A8H7EU42_9FUNG|nr:hypothetical protein EC973_007557 [Apophysomyces ossiformis]
MPTIPSKYANYRAAQALGAKYVFFQNYDLKDWGFENFLEQKGSSGGIDEQRMHYVNLIDGIIEQAPPKAPLIKVLKDFREEAIRVSAKDHLDGYRISPVAPRENNDKGTQVIIGDGNVIGDGFMAAANATINLVTSASEDSDSRPEKRFKAGKSAVDSEKESEPLQGSPPYSLPDSDYIPSDPLTVSDFDVHTGFRWTLDMNELGAAKDDILSDLPDLPLAIIDELYKDAYHTAQEGQLEPYDTTKRLHLSSIFSLDEVDEYTRNMVSLDPIIAELPNVVYTNIRALDRAITTNSPFTPGPVTTIQEVGFNNILLSTFTTQPNSDPVELDWDVTSWVYKQTIGACNRLRPDILLLTRCLQIVNGVYVYSKFPELVLPTTYDTVSHMAKSMEVTMAFKQHVLKSLGSGNIEKVDVWSQYKNFMRPTVAGYIPQHESSFVPVTELINDAKYDIEQLTIKDISSLRTVYCFVETVERMLKVITMGNVCFFWSASVPTELFLVPDALFLIK